MQKKIFTVILSLIAVVLVTPITLGAIFGAEFTGTGKSAKITVELLVLLWLLCGMFFYRKIWIFVAHGLILFFGGLAAYGLHQAIGILPYMTVAVLVYAIHRWLLRDPVEQKSKEQEYLTETTAPYLTETTEPERKSEQFQGMEQEQAALVREREALERVRSALEQERQRKALGEELEAIIRERIALEDELRALGLSVPEQIQKIEESQKIQEVQHEEQGEPVSTYAAITGIMVVSCVLLAVVLLLLAIGR